MRALARILKWLACILGAVLLLAVALVAAVWYRPELLLNETRARQALRYAPAGTEASWQTFAWHFSPEGWLGKRFDLRITGLCFRYGKALSGCAPELHLDVSFSLSHFRPRITRVGSAVVEVNELTYRPAATPEVPSTSPLPDLRPPSFASVYPAGVDLSLLGEIRLRLQNFRLESAGGETLTGSFSAVKESSAPGQAELAVSAEAERGRALHLKLSGRGRVIPEKSTLEWRGNLAGELSGWRLRFPLDLAWSKRVLLRGNPWATRGKEEFESPLHLAWSDQSVDLELSHLAFTKLWPRKRVLLDSCHLKATLRANRGYPENSDLHCEVALESLQRGALLPPMRAALDSSLKLRPLNAREVEAELEVRERGQNEYLNSELNLAAKAKVEVARGALSEKPDLKFSAHFEVPSLQKWRASLDHTPFAVPAPFRTLEGPAQLDLSLGQANADLVEVVAKLHTGFRGEGESFETNHLAHVQLSNPWKGAKSLNVSADAELTDVALVAPPLRLEDPPQALPDRRFFSTRAKALKKKVAHSSIPLHWQVNLTTKQPLRIRTNLLPDEIPVSLKLTFADNRDMAGTVTVEPMHLTVFKKKAQVRNVTLTFHDGSPVAELNGLLVTHNPEVTIKILLLGSTEKPRIDFLSEPPLTRQQIVAVLLFNKSVSELSEEDASSAGSFSQATADGALGLFSLLFLSNTPIESISYDPVSQTYAARLRLDKKTTLAVGSNFDKERQVALRRRLGGRWAIRTELHGEDGQPDVLLTLLEWFKRF